MGFSYLSAAEFIRWLRHLERAKRNWNSRRLLERAKRNWNRLQPLEQSLRPIGPPAGLFCIVCWQEILSPSYYPLERPPAYWNARSANGTEPQALPGTPARLLERPSAYWNARSAWNSWNAAGFWPALQRLEHSQVSFRPPLSPC